jgi:serine/threonine-protein kinase
VSDDDLEPPGDPGELRARRRRQRGWVVAVVVVLLLAVAAAAGGWWLSGRWASTPASLGLTRAVAEQTVRDAGLVPLVRSEPRDDVPAGRVADTDPVAGSSQLRGSEVVLVVSSGRPVVPAVPAGAEPGAALAALRAAGLTASVDDRAEHDDMVPAGAVLRTRPAAGAQLHVGEPVHVVLSAGPAPVAVPDVTGKPAADARNALLVAGFEVGPPTSRVDPTVPADTTLGTDPEAGTPVDHGGTVSLVVATSVEVPDVTDGTVAQARDRLTALGLQVRTVKRVGWGSVDGSGVSEQDPRPGTRVAPGAVVQVSAWW